VTAAPTRRRAESTGSRVGCAGPGRCAAWPRPSS